jgi:8-oxo-dGTP pyrophosphatase MutT (NUDIX family)
MPWIHPALRVVARASAGRHHVAAAAVIVSDGEVLVVRHVFRDGEWGLPGGWIQRRETPFGAIEREVEEELGVVVAAVEVVHAELQGAGGGASALTFAVRCEPVRPGRPELTLSPELDAARWLPPEACVDVVSGFELSSIERALQRRG